MKAQTRVIQQIFWVFKYQFAHLLCHFLKKTKISVEGTARSQIDLSNLKKSNCRGIEMGEYFYNYLTYKHNITKSLILGKEQVIYKNKKVKIICLFKM
jgi:hypothetical protein